MRDGLSVSSLDVAAAVLLALLLVTALGISWKIERNANGLGHADRENTALVGCVTSMRNTVSFMDSWINQFIAEGNTSVLNLYFEETLGNNGREEALENARELESDTQVYEHLRSAFRLSGELETIQLRAVRLFYEAGGINTEQVPDPIRNVQLSEEAKLSNYDKWLRPFQLLHGMDYGALREEFEGELDTCMELLESARARGQKEAVEKLHSLFFVQGMVIDITLLIVASGVTMLFSLLLRPMKRTALKIEKGESLPSVLLSFARSVGQSTGSTRKTGVSGTNCLLKLSMTL